jgi:hypothetical protein
VYTCAKFALGLGVELQPTISNISIFRHCYHEVRYSINPNIKIRHATRALLGPFGLDRMPTGNF